MDLGVDDCRHTRVAHVHHGGRQAFVFVVSKNLAEVVVTDVLAKSPDERKAGQSNAEVLFDWSIVTKCQVRKETCQAPRRNIPADCKVTAAFFPDLVQSAPVRVHGHRACRGPLFKRAAAGRLIQKKTECLHEGNL